MKRTGGDPERGPTGERPLTWDIDMTLIVELNDHRFDPKTILNALNSPAYPLGIRQRCCSPTEPIAGELLDASSMDEALSLPLGERSRTGAPCRRRPAMTPRRPAGRTARACWGVYPCI